MSQVGIQLTVKKVEAAKRLVTAIASVVTKADGAPVVDSQGDSIKIDDLENAFIEAFSRGGLKKGGEMHESIGGADVVQHFTLSKAERVALGFGDGEELGIVKFYVTDDALWDKVQKGVLPDISIAGLAERQVA